MFLWNVKLLLDNMIYCFFVVSLSCVLKQNKFKRNLKSAVVFALFFFFFFFAFSLLSC